MLSQGIYIYQPASVGSGDYTATLYFSSSTKAKYLAIGDYLEDSVGNKYEVISGTTIPFSDGATVKVHYLDNDVSPVQDIGFDSKAYTPGQIDYAPKYRTSGNITSASIYASEEYEYTVSATWDSPSQSNQVVVGDKFVDKSGKEYEITFLTGSKFGDPFRCKEVEKIGQLPEIGVATVYHPTENQEFFQGMELTDPARTNIFNRDKVIIDQKLGIGSGGGGSLTKSMQNKSGATIDAGKPVSKKADGSIVPADSDSADGQTFVGITVDSIADDATGDVYLVGQNIPGALTGLGFTPGQDIFISESTGFTNNPDSFSGGDDTITRVGIADCAAGAASDTVTDLIIFAEIQVTP